jgi:hypothetical protein
VTQTNCKDIVLLEEVVDNVKNSSSVQEMEHLLDDLTKNIKAIITSGQDNLDMLNETKASQCSGILYNQYKSLHHIQSTRLLMI